ncbi:MAG: lipopolysaccharide cholinephosphotransferase, partial [Atopobiaceae bacterium]|nr:lipopolysaccharide cholinephosphotransferase [Atopobiaceae bacterium]
PLTGWKKKVALAGCFVIHHGLKLFRVSSAFIQRKWDEAARAAEDENTNHYASFVEPDPENWSMDKEDPGALDFGKWKDVDVTKGSRQAFEDFGQKS